MEQPAMQGAERQARPDVRIDVNEQSVTVHEHRLTGLEIKQAAIAQGVRIEIDFVLSLHLGPQKTRVVGDNDPVEVHPGSKFTAVAPDDNS